MGFKLGPLVLEGYVDIVLKMILAFGLAFQMPLLLLLLGWIGVLSAAALRAKRPYAIVAIFVIAAILTPPDAISQIAMAVPMCLLYELCIVLIWLRERVRQQ
jgi:sec-independent protein translocase protein TatC